MKIGGEDDDFIPKEFALKQNYPNPFNPSTTIEYDLPKAAQVKIAIFNLLGKKVKTILDTHKNAGPISSYLIQTIWPVVCICIELKPGNIQILKK